MTIMERLTAQLHMAARNVPGEELRSAQDTIERLGATFHQVTDPSHHEDVTGVLTDLRQASQQLSAALSRAQQIANALAAFTQHVGLPPIRRTILGSASVAVPIPTAPQMIADPTPPRPPSVPVAGSVSAASVSQDRPGYALSVTEVQRLKAVLPVFAGPGSKTHGTFVTSPGTEKPLVSGEEPVTKAIASGLGLRRVATAETHVEAHAAAQMRRYTILRAALVINNDVCGGPLGCRVILPRLLPPGSALTVYGPNGFEETYHGRDEPA